MKTPSIRRGTSDSEIANQSADMAEKFPSSIACPICGKLCGGSIVPDPDDSFVKGIAEHIMGCYEKWMFEDSNFLIYILFNGIETSSGAHDMLQDAYECARSGSKFNRSALVMCRGAIDGILLEALAGHIYIGADSLGHVRLLGGYPKQLVSRLNKRPFVWHKLAEEAKQRGIADDRMIKKAEKLRMLGNLNAHLSENLVRSTSENHLINQLNRSYSGMEVLTVFAETVEFMIEVCQRWLVVSTWAWRRQFSGALRRPELRLLKIQPCGCPI